MRNNSYFVSTLQPQRWVVCSTFSLDSQASKKVLIGDVRTRLIWIIQGLAAEKEWGIRALEVARLPYPFVH